MGRRGVRSGDRAALRQLERDAVDRRSSIPNNDTALYDGKCATCHGAESQGLAGRAVARRHRRNGTRARRSPRSSARAPAACPAFPIWAARNINDLVDFLITGRTRRRILRDERSHLAQVPQRRLQDVARSGRLSADHAAMGHAQRDRPQRGHHPMDDSVRRISRSSSQRASRTPAATTTAGPSSRRADSCSSAPRTTTRSSTPTTS